MSVLVHLQFLWNVLLSQSSLFPLPNLGEFSDEEGNIQCSIIQQTEVIHIDRFLCRFWWRVGAVIHSSHTTLQNLHVAIMYTILPVHCRTLWGQSWVSNICRELVKMLHFVAISDQPKLLHAQVLTWGSLVECTQRQYAYLLHTWAAIKLAGHSMSSRLFSNMHNRCITLQLLLLFILFCKMNRRDSSFRNTQSLSLAAWNVKSTESLWYSQSSDMAFFHPRHIDMKTHKQKFHMHILCDTWSQPHYTTPI